MLEFRAIINRRPSYTIFFIVLIVDATLPLRVQRRIKH